MDVMQSQYYRLNVFLLWIIGLWPLAHGIHVQLQRIFFSMSLLYIIVNQLNFLRDAYHDATGFSDHVSYTLLLTAVLLKYNSYLYTHSIRKDLMNMLKRDWYTIQNPEERDILKMYGSRGEFHTKVFALLILLMGGSFSGIPLYAILLDKLAPLKEPRSRQYPVHIHMFFDQKRYFGAVIVITVMYNFIAITTLVATEAISIQCLQHACALWEITSHRIQKAFQISLKDDPVSKGVAVRTLANGIEMHIQTLDFCKFLKRNFAQPYLLLLGIGIASLSMNLFRFSLLLSASEQPGDGITSLFICVGILSYMFYMNYMTQEVVDKSSSLFIRSYTGPWYQAPLPMQKQLLMILLKSINAFTMDLFGLFNPSIEGFLMIARMSVSYFMMLQSFQ